jgi:hypothetical protein
METPGSEKLTALGLTVIFFVCRLNRAAAAAL